METGRGLEVGRSWGRRGWGILLSMGKDKKVSEVDFGDGSTTRMHLMPLNGTRKRS